MRLSSNDDEYIGCPDTGDKDAFAARVHGDSMQPDYREGDIVIFSPAAEVESGDDCFVRFDDGHTTFKRVYFETDESGCQVIRLQPHNLTYKAQTVPADRVAGMFRAEYKYERVNRNDKRLR